MGFVSSLLPRKHRRVVRDTWELIDAKLGAYVRGTLLLVAFVATVLSLSFWAIGVPFWLLLGVFAGVVEIVPVIGPLLAGRRGGGRRLHRVVAGRSLRGHRRAGGAAVRGLHRHPAGDGSRHGASPLLVLVSVSAIGLLFGGFYVLMATPFVALIATLVDVIVRDKDPAEQDVPTVLFAKESRLFASGRRSGRRE